MSETHKKAKAQQLFSWTTFSPNGDFKPNPNQRKERYKMKRREIVEEALFAPKSPNNDFLSLK